MELLKKIGNYFWSKNFAINFGLVILVWVLGIWILRGCLDSNTVHGEKIEVPNLIGKNQNNLKSLLAKSGLEYEVLDSIYDPSKVEGTVLAQDPEASKLTDVFVKSTHVVKVRVSKRTQLVEMPELVDKSQRFAATVLKSRGFRYSLEYKPSLEAHGAVLEQLYKNKPVQGGTRLPIGSKIKLIVGRGEAGVPQDLPDLFGLSIEEAKARVARMNNMSFQPVCEGCVTKEDSLAARVEAQSPEYSDGMRVASGTTISVYATKPEEENP
ncbi:MAG: PASTA domain-containing protein [Crocinitomicaceae bacterium]|nr:PASTA domain-containing protein [Crocinitomicaceae bacterium]